MAAGPSEGSVAALLEAQLPDYGAAAEWAIGAARPALAVAIAEDCLLTTWSTDEPGRWLDSLFRSDDSGQSWMPSALAVGAHFACSSTTTTPLERLALQRAIGLDPTRSLAHAQACLASMFAGDSTNVVTHGRRSVDTATDTMERTLGLMVLGNALFFTERFEEAANVLAELRQLGEANAFPTAIATAHHMTGILLAEADPDAALVESGAGLAAVDGLDRFVSEANLRREIVPALMRTDPPAAIRVAADLLQRCDDHNDTGQIRSGLAYLVTILHDIGEPELAAETAGRCRPPAPRTDKRHSVQRDRSSTPPAPRPGLRDAPHLRTQPLHEGPHQSHPRRPLVERLS